MVQIGRASSLVPRETALPVCATGTNWSGIPDLNWRPHAPQACALPTAPIPDFFVVWVTRLERALFVPFAKRGTKCKMTCGLGDPT